MTEANNNIIDIDQKQAENTAMSLNVMFTNVIFYGGEHPAAQEKVKDFSLCLNNIFTFFPMVTLLRRGKSLYIEKWCVDQRMNVSRLVTMFQKRGIESISFLNGVSVEDIKAFVIIFTNQNTFSTSEKFSQELLKRNISKIRINYVFYQKITKDETVIPKGTKTIVGDWYPSTGKTGQEEMLSQVGKLFSLKDVLENPGKVINSIVSETQENDFNNSQIIKQLKELKKEVRSSKEMAVNFSTDDMIESIFSLTTELKQKLAVQKEMDKIDSKTNPVIDEIEQLTYETIARIIREEYKKGEISIKRLARTIRRIVPDVKELKRLLPRLKKVLFTEGMSLTDFLHLTRELVNDLQEENLIYALEEGADETGLSVDEIIDAINANPRETAKLIVLASEIRQGPKADHSGLSKLLSDYVESVSGKMALEHRDVTGYNGANVLKDVVRHIENDIVGQLKDEGVSSSVITEVEKQLAKRFPKTLNKLKAEWIVTYISNEDDFSGMNFVKLMEKSINKKDDFKGLKDPLEKNLLKHGFSTSEIKKMFKKFSDNRKKNEAESSLPKYVLNTNNTKYFLQRQIKEYVRYKNPFSCMNISVSSIMKKGQWVSATNSDAVQVNPEVCNILKMELRDFDLIGTLDKSDDYHLLVILPRTDETGAYTVKGRLDKRFYSTKFQLNNETVKLRIIASVAPYSIEKTPDYKSFIGLIKTRHGIEQMLGK